MIGFELENISVLGQAIDIARYKYDLSNEDFNHCVLRERGREILTCAEYALPFFVVDYSGSLLLTNIAELDSGRYHGCHFLPRQFSSNPNWPEGFVPVESAEDVTLIRRWPELIVDPVKYLNRSVRLLSHKDMLDSIQGKQSFDFPVFVKTAEKLGAQLHHCVSGTDDLRLLLTENPEELASRGLFDSYSSEALIARITQPRKVYNEYTGYWDTKPPVIESIPESNTFILSDVVDFMSHAESDNKQAEYRCFVINGQLATTGLTADYHSEQLPSRHLTFADEFVLDHKGILPGNYTLDIGISPNDLPFVIEINPLSRSGRYAGCEAFAIFSTALTDERLNVPHHLLDPANIDLRISEIHAAREEGIHTFNFDDWLDNVHRVADHPVELGS